MRNVCVIGNSFSNFGKTMPERMNLSKTNAMYPLLPFLKEHPVEMDLCSDGVTPIPDVYNAFHDLSTHFMDEAGWEKASESGLWTQRPREVIMGEMIDTGVNEELSKAIEDIKEHEEHERELKDAHDKILKEIDEEFYCSTDMPEKEEESDSDSDSDSDDEENDMFENMYTGWGAQVKCALQPDRLIPEWSLDASTINAYTLGEKDPRKRIYVYNDEGVSPSSKQMVVHTLRSFSDPAKYMVDTLDADEMKNNDWEDNAAMLVFPGGADMYYRVRGIA